MHSAVDEGDRNALNREIGSNVRALMAKRGVTGREIAALLDMNPASLSDRLSGHTPFRADELVIIAKRLDYQIETLIHGFGSPISLGMETLWPLEPNVVCEQLVLSAA